MQKKYKENACGFPQALVLLLVSALNQCVIEGIIIIHNVVFHRIKVSKISEVKNVSTPEISGVRLYVEYVSASLCKDNKL